MNSSCLCKMYMKKNVQLQTNYLNQSPEGCKSKINFLIKSLQTIVTIMALNEVCDVSLY